MNRFYEADPIYEIYLPLRYSDGHPIEEEKFGLTREELVGRFGGLTSTPPGFPLEGWWRSLHGVVRDDIAIWTVVTQVDDDLFFLEYKETLKQRFIQEDIFLVKVPGETL